MRTYSPKKEEITRSWWVVDAQGAVLGRLATQVASVLRGKHKETFSPHIDTGDPVIIVNADKVVLTSDKAEKGRVWRHSGYPGGIKSTTYGELLQRNPEELVRRAVKGMLPHNRLGRQQLHKLFVYAGPEHPHQAQRPSPMVLGEHPGLTAAKSRAQVVKGAEPTGAQAAEQSSEVSGGER
jgi:large subunit ribosomal protein L13